MTYREHIEQLVEELDVRWTPITDWTQAKADMYARIAYFVTPVDERTYWSALHELGHLACNHTDRITMTDYLTEMAVGPTPKRAKMEAEAWDWALNHAMEAPGDVAKQAMQLGFGSYYATGFTPSEVRPPEVQRLVTLIGFPDSPMEIWAQVKLLAIKAGLNPQELGASVIEQQEWQIMKLGMIYHSHHGDGAYGTLDDLPDAVDITVEKLTPYVDKFDSIVVTGMSGVVVGVPVALQLHKPVVILRRESERDDSHSSDMLLNRSRLGKRVCFLDDFVCGGETRARVVREMEKEAVEITVEYQYAYDTITIDGEQKPPPKPAPPLDILF